MLKFSFSDAMKNAVAKKGADVAKIARKVELATDPAGRAWRKQDARMRRIRNLSVPSKA